MRLTLEPADVLPLPITHGGYIVPFVLGPFPSTNLVSGAFVIVIFGRKHFLSDLIREFADMPGEIGKCLVKGFDLIGRVLDANERVFDFSNVHG